MTDADRDGIFAHWPNRITGLRFLGALALFALLSLVGDDAPHQAQGLYLASLLLFVAVAASDALDGYLARKYGVVTAFGRIADPFVDKVLVVGAMVFLSSMPWSAAILPPWVTVVILAREFLVTGIRGYAESIGHEFPADGFGKLKMIVQSIAVGVLLGIHALPWPVWFVELLHFLAHAAVVGTLITTVGSGATYVRRVAGMTRRKDVAA
ncbi:MAG: CDP-diacylglycerol--glycerol-3-phosphate 3-phosphatidyltransferase [Planctomycetota bacterium]